MLWLTNVDTIKKGSSRNPLLLVGRGGFEPPANGLKVLRHTKDIKYLQAKLLTNNCNHCLFF